jgi:DNA-binding response OmpR family regulator
VRLLIVDDAPDILALLKLAFQLDGYAVDAASSAAEALELADVHRYDVLILDLLLPDGDGLQLCRQLRAAAPPLLILILSARSERDAIVAGLDAGADDYVAKPFDYRELVARVRALLRRDLRAREPLLRCGSLMLDPAQGTATYGDALLVLPRKQLRILDYLLRHQGELVSQEQLLEHVWNAEANPFTNAVRVHIAAIRRALGRSVPEPCRIVTVIGSGYRLEPAPAAELTQALSAASYAVPQRGQKRRGRIAMDTQLTQVHTGAPTLLLVDDAPAITQLLTVYFHQAQLNTLVAYDGRTALELAQRAEPDLIVLDLGLPDLDGLLVCRQIRQHSAVPIVMLTKRAGEQERQQGLDAGASAYLTKPFDADALLTQVQALLPAKP